VHEQAGPHVWFLILNALEGPFADVRVRQAANYADQQGGDRQRRAGRHRRRRRGSDAARLRMGLQRERWSPIPTTPTAPARFWPRRGMENPEVTFYVTEGGSGMLDPIAMGTAIQADLEAVGFDVTIETYEWNTFLGEVNPGLEGKADMAEMAWMTNDPDTLPYLALRTAAWPAEGGFNSGYYSNPEVDALLEEARTATDQDRRAELYRRCRSSCRRTRPGSSSPTGCRTRSRATGSKASGLSRPSSCS
jgi:peptide/nickel transport system substrate-binding protein